MQKDMVRSVDTSWAIIMFMGGILVAILIIAGVRATLLPARDASTVGVYALPQNSSAQLTNTSRIASHVVIPPVLGDAVLGSQNVCGCPGCCSVLST